MAPHANFDNVEHQIVRLPAPERPPFSKSPPRLLIIGEGNRGITYAAAICESTNGARGIFGESLNPLKARSLRIGGSFYHRKKSGEERLP
ncbi:uncharacterized protein BP5553_10169 [Venustampulla echinocandica]|uniref:Uncharacterized protein n=1 Tax=Venustampulla echinocandica TaxID=2656787 RepID=A0A370TAI4_9HELO|nr:uncharacterized protein BP5553_10169 [Venustampulla echinocandica]RDL30824.1 hypothetical protein BP5553_10169 [Venustampulla echinocandica]